MDTEKNPNSMALNMGCALGGLSGFLMQRVTQYDIFQAKVDFEPV